MKRILLAPWRCLVAAGNWVMQPPDFEVCDWANKTHGGDE